MRNKLCKLFSRLKPFIAVTFLQTGFAGMDVLSKAALNDGMSNYVLVVYRHAVAFVIFAPFAVILEKKARPKMTLPLFIRIMVLSILEPVIDQNLYFLGMKYTTATFAASMSNILPAITFVMAWVLRLEKVRIKSIRSQAKIIGTLATVGGAMMMTLIKGPVVIDLALTNGNNNHEHRGGETIHHEWIKGSLMITVGCFSWAGFMILQAKTIKVYPAELSLTTYICLLGTIGGTIVALVMEGGKTSIWSLGLNTKTLAALYSGLFCSGLAYYIQGMVMKDRGPVFVTAFSPLCMVIVAIMGSFILGEIQHLGRLLGAVVIVVGLYLVIWGKSKDYKPSSTDEEKTQVEQIEGAESTPRTEENNHQAIIIDASNEGIVNIEERLYDTKDPLTV